MEKVTLYYYSSKNRLHCTTGLYHRLYQSLMHAHNPNKKLAQEAGMPSQSRWGQRHTNFTQFCLNLKIAISMDLIKSIVIKITVMWFFTYYL